MNKAEAAVIRQAALLARDVVDKSATETDRNLRLVCLVHAVHTLSEYRKRHKKRGEKVKHPAGIVPYDKSLERFTKTL